MSDKAYTDPSGFFFGRILNFVKRNWRVIAVVAIAVAAPYLLPAMAPILLGAIVGAVSGYIMTGTLKGAVFGAMMGAAGGAFMGGGIGGYGDPNGMNPIANMIIDGSVNFTSELVLSEHNFRAAGMNQSLDSGGVYRNMGATMDSGIEIRTKNATVSDALGGPSGDNSANGARTEAYTGLLVDDVQRAVGGAGSVLNTTTELIEVGATKTGTPLPRRASRALGTPGRVLGNVGTGLEVIMAGSHEERLEILGLEAANRALEVNPSIMGPVAKAWNLASAFVNATVGRKIMPDAATGLLKMSGTRARHTSVTYDVLNKTDPDLANLYRNMENHPGIYP